MMFGKHPFVQWMHRLSPAQLLIFFYLLAIIFSTAILSVPAAYKEGVDVSFIDTMFTAVSALSVTGLTTISVGDTLSTTGLLLLTVILHLGAVGVMAVSTFIWLLLGKRIGLSERRLIMQDQNQTTFGGIVDLIKQILFVILIVEFLGVLVLGTYFLNYFPSAKSAYFNGYFSTISAISNGGFSINNDSMALYSHDYFVQSVIIFFIIFGAIGFPVLIEVKAFLFSKRKGKRPFRFSLFTKLTTTTFFILIVAGTLFIYLFDMLHFFSGKGFWESFFYALFQSVTTRSAGLSTMDVSLLTETNHLFMSFLMFIGASPSSSGGGIRTTTFALVIIFLITYARGGRKIKVFNREVYDQDLLKAVTVTTMALILVFTSLIMMTIMEPFSVTELLFEATSAFGTVGLSLGITSELTTLSKIILMILMFIGRIGLVTFLLTFKKEHANDDYIRYPKEKIIIG